MTLAAALSWSEVLPRLTKTPLILFLDVDGTLSPIAPRPQDAVVPERTRQLVQQLTRRDGVHVVLISGRAAGDACRLVGVDAAWVIGNHGMETLAPHGALSVDPRVERHRDQVARARDFLHAALRGVPGVDIEDKTWTLSVHYRRAAPEVVPFVRDAVTQSAHEQELLRTEGKMVFELRPPIGVNKGTAAIAFVERMGGEDAEVSILCAGDDRTDEDAFRLLRARYPEAVTVRVAGGGSDEPTAAELVVPDVQAVASLLERILAVR